ncbi:Abi family protein [Bifidobacterium callimiconis]|nr:Abi family protein [Bifidobacterium callimiconis]
MDELMQHLSDNGVAIDETQRQELKNLGYYHGYKGYRFAGMAKNRFPLTDFAQVIALNDFDMSLKSLAYPEIMFVETALKNYTLEAVLADAGSESFDQVYMQSLTAYRAHRGTSDYKPALLQRMRLRNEIDALMAQRYKSSVPVIQHFLDEDKAIPIWALFEVMTLGTFGTFYKCLDARVKAAIVSELGLPSNYDSATVLGNIIFALKDFRNAIAHNGVVMDVRFKQARVNRDIGKMLAGDTGMIGVDFGEITDYMALLAYLMTKLQAPEHNRLAFLDGYVSLLDSYQQKLPQPIFSRLVHTGARQKLQSIRTFASL